MPNFHLRQKAAERGRDPKVDRLRKLKLFAEATPAELKRVATFVDEAELPSGHVLMREGAPGREVFVIVDGHALVTLRGSAMALLGPGEVVGEMATLEHQPRSATVIAQSPLRVLVCGPLELSAIIDLSPSVRRNLLAMLSERVRNVEHPRENRSAS